MESTFNGLGTNNGAGTSFESTYNSESQKNAK